MSLSRVIYTKDWNRPSDFPTIETSEAQVRADIQELYNQVRSGVNLIADELESTLTLSGASQIGLAAIDGVAATNLQAAILELKSNLDTKAASTILGEYETVESAKGHIVNVSLDAKTGVLTFTKEGGDTIEIDTTLEKIPTTMKFFEETDPDTGKSIYYLGIYDAEGVLISSTNVSSLFNELTPGVTDTVTLSTEVDAKGVKTISASINDHSIGSQQINAEYTDTLAQIRDDAEMYASNSAASASNANDYQLKAKSYAIGDETTRPGSTEDNAMYYSDMSAEYAVQAQSYAVGGTGSRTEEDTDNAKYYKEQSAAIKKSTAAYGDAAADSAKESADQAILAKSYAVGGTGTRPGEDEANAKYYMEVASARASGFDYKGAWDASTVYTANQIVSYDSTIWTAVTNNVNSLPYEGSSDWAVFIGVPSVLDLGAFTDETLAEHILSLNAHSTMAVDANLTEATTQDSLYEHETATDAHGNITIDGGGN